MIGDDEPLVRREGCRGRERFHREGAARCTVKAHPIVRTLAEGRGCGGDAVSLVDLRGEGARRGVAHAALWGIGERIRDRVGVGASGAGILDVEPESTRRADAHQPGSTLDHGELGLDHGHGRAGARRAVEHAARVPVELVVGIGCAVGEGQTRDVDRAVGQADGNVYDRLGPGGNVHPGARALDDEVARGPGVDGRPAAGPRDLRDPDELQIRGHGGEAVGDSHVEQRRRVRGGRDRQAIGERLTDARRGLRGCLDQGRRRQDLDDDFRGVLVAADVRVGLAVDVGVVAVGLQRCAR